MKFAPAFQLGAAPKWNPRLDVSSAPRRGKIRVWIPDRRNSEMKSAFGCQLDAMPMWNLRLDAS